MNCATCIFRKRTGSADLATFISTILAMTELSRSMDWLGDGWYLDACTCMPGNWANLKSIPTPLIDSAVPSVEVSKLTAKWASFRMLILCAKSSIKDWKIEDGRSPWLNCAI